jgi:hypothetical protein
VMVSTGCGVISNTPPVSGVITLDGQPLANAHIAFQPEATGGNTVVGPVQWRH